MATPTASDLQKEVGTFKPGSIRFVRLQNFLTYTNVEFKPGPRLNIVCGQNGSGKSTLLCAICLGLGGEPKTLGRADDVRQFIRREQDVAEIEIELEPFEEEEEEDTHVIRRVIDRAKGSKHGHGRGASTFYINDKVVAAKEVRQLVTSTYRIQIDNLCTFLPQERVGNFSSLTPQLLLEETEKALSENLELYHGHQKLIELEATIDSGASDVGTLRTRLKELEEENKRLEREKMRMEERERALEQAALYRMKLMWLRFDEARDVALQLKVERTQAMKKLNAAKQKIMPLENNHSLVRLNMQRAIDQLQVEEKTCKQTEQNLLKLHKKYEKHDEAIDDIMVQLKHLSGNRERLRQDLEAARQRLEKLEAAFQGLPSKKDVMREYEDAAQAKKSYMTVINHCKRDVVGQQQQVRDVEESARRLQEKLRKLNDDKARRNERIFRLEPKLKQAYDWLQQNRARFRRQIWGPIVCEVTTNSEAASAFLEQHVPNAILKAFVVECREDFDLLYKLVRQDLGIAINIQKIDDGKLEATKRPYSDTKMALLKNEHGIAGYLDETFVAPDAVIQALKTVAAVHEVLVGNEITQRSIDQKKLVDFLTEPDPAIGQTKPLSVVTVFSSDGNKSYKYTSTLSRYSHKSVIRVDEIKQARWLAQGVDPAQKASTEEQLRLAVENVEQIRQMVQDAEATLAKEEAKAEAVTTRFKNAATQKETLEKLLVRLANAKQKVRDAEAAVRKSRDDVEKTKLCQSLKNHVSDSVATLEAHAELNSQLMQANRSTVAITIKKESLSEAERQARSKLDEMRHEVNDLDKLYSVAASNFAKARENLVQLKGEAEREAPLVDGNGDELPLKKKLDELEVTTKEDAETALEEATAKANSIADNPDVVREYNERRAEIKTLQDKLRLAQGSRESKIAELQKILVPWERKLSTSMERANILFAKYMEELGCAGEVALNKGDGAGSANQERGHYKNWGVEIRVKFREKRNLQVLSGHFHSGGERSVSTIMFLMALQELMVSPFRCVDEINQGLDERNERLVFKRIVTNSTGRPKNSLTDHSGQYFLITPKLLPNLSDMEVEAVTVLCIINSSLCGLKPDDWNPKRFIELRKKHGPIPSIGSPVSIKESTEMSKESPVVAIEAKEEDNEAQYVI